MKQTRSNFSPHLRFGATLKPSASTAPGSVQCPRPLTSSTSSLKTPATRLPPSPPLTGASQASSQLGEVVEDGVEHCRLRIPLRKVLWDAVTCSCRSHSERRQRWSRVLTPWTHCRDDGTRPRQPPVLTSECTVRSLMNLPDSHLQPRCSATVKLDLALPPAPTPPHPPLSPGLPLVLAEGPRSGTARQAAQADRSLPDAQGDGAGPLAGAGPRGQSSGLHTDRFRQDQCFAQSHKQQTLRAGRWCSPVPFPSADPCGVNDTFSPTVRAL